MVNEYLNDCEVIQNGEPKLVPAMGALETIFIDGLKLEAFTTSGGLGTMCETFKGRVDELNYKTMRYVGHCELCALFFNELHLKNDRKTAGEILVNAKPPVNDDVVYVHAAVEGHKDGTLSRDEFVKAYYPLFESQASAGALSLGQQLHLYVLWSRWWQIKHCQHRASSSKKKSRLTRSWKRKMVRSTHVGALSLFRCLIDA